MHNESYWRRIHQIPGVAVCALHRELLQQSKVRYGNSSNRLQFVAAEDAIGEVYGMLGFEAEIDLWMAQASAWILQNPQLTCSHDEYRTWLIDRLAALGFANWSGQIRLSALLSEFSARYDSDFLERVGCALRAEEGPWIERLVHKPRGHQHPLRYLVMLNFVQTTPSELFAAIQPAPPFGSAPWPCLNAASEHYGELTVLRCDIRYGWNGKSLVGEFSCESCGMIYSRSGPDKDPADRLKRDHVPQFGPVWESALRRIWTNSEYSLRQVGRALGVDPATARLQAKRMGLPIERPGYRDATLDQRQLRSC